jgi:hypothetical protein
MRSIEVTSKVLNMDFENYEEGRFVYQKKYIIKDSYKPAPSQKGHGEYRISLVSPEIRDEDELNKQINHIRAIVKKITILFKCITGSAFNLSDRYMDSFTGTLILPEDLPSGWESNYTEIKEDFDRKKKMHVSLVFVGNIHYVVLNKSPFADLMHALRRYDKLPRYQKDLLSIINDIDIVSSSARYMLIGKALEIVDSMYPLNGHIDHRIEQFFPEFASSFDKVTIKYLIGLTNTRKEARHYVKEKVGTTPHPAMTEEELKTLYDLSNLLCINIVRKGLGLGFADFRYDSSVI